MVTSSLVAVAPVASCAVIARTLVATLVHSWKKKHVLSAVMSCSKSSTCTSANVSCVRTKAFPAPSLIQVWPLSIDR